MVKKKTSDFFFLVFDSALAKFIKAAEVKTKHNAPCVFGLSLAFPVVKLFN